MSQEILWNGVRMENPKESFRLGTDSVVLADFAKPAKGAKVCDLGCGSGAISMMLLANDPSLCVTGVEIQPELAALADDNGKSNGFSRFTAICGDLRNIRELLPANGFSCVVSNPPYFPADSLLPQDASLALSRTEITCTPDDLCAAAKWLLTSGGSFALCHKPERLADLIFSLREHNLEPKRLQFVRHSEKSKRSLVLIRSVLDGKPGLDICDDLILYNSDGTPTEDCRRIYHR